MWLLGNSQRSQKSQLEERAVSYLLTSMNELTLNNATNTLHHSSNRATEVSHTHTHTHVSVPVVCTRTHTEPLVCVSYRIRWWTLDQV